MDGRRRVSTCLAYPADNTKKGELKDGINQIIMLMHELPRKSWLSLRPGERLRPTLLAVWLIDVACRALAFFRTADAWAFLTRFSSSESLARSSASYSLTANRPASLLSAILSYFILPEMQSFPIEPLRALMQSPLYTSCLWSSSVLSSIEVSNSALKRNWSLFGQQAWVVDQ